MANGPAIRLKYLGHISLGIAAGGLLVLWALVHAGVLHGVFWGIVLTGFEAAIIGGLADWFAVTAMFRRVPIPLLGRHTNILVRNKERVALAIEKMVTDNFFNSANVDRLLVGMSASQKVIDHLETDRNLEEALGVILEEVTPFLSSPQLSEFLAGEFKGAFKDRDLAAVLAVWIPKAVSQGMHQKLWSVTLDLLGKAVAKDEIRELVRRWLEKAGRDYKDKSWWKSFVGWLAETTAGIEYSELADSLVRKLGELVRQAESPRSEMRRLFDERLLAFAEQLKAGHADHSATVRTLAKALVEYDKLPLLIQSFLLRVRKQLQQQAPDPDSELMGWLSGRARQLLYEFSLDADKRMKLDELFRDRLKEYLEPARMGETVRLYLAEMDVGQFRDLIEGKVGDELQWIRLNGALIGGLVGLIIGVLRFIPF